IVQRCPLFREWSAEHMGAAFDQFLAYKQRVPVRGAILLNDTMDEVLLVKGFKKSATWSFPRGKINKDELDLDCAIREAWEETGFDIRAAGLATGKKNRSIEMTLRGQNMKLYVFRSVPKDAKFEPQTRKEISKIEWYKLADLPTLSKKQKVHREGEAALNANKFYMVAPFVIPLKKIIAMLKRGDNRHSPQAQAAPIADETILAGNSDNIASTSEPVIALSASEASLPQEQDLLAALKSQLNIGPAPSASPVVKEDKSNALLALLRGGPTQAAQPVPIVSHQPQLESTAQIANQRSPQNMYTLHERTHRAAPPSSALPQLTQQKQSLLDVFSNRPAASPAPTSPVRSPAPDAKQNLLAAFLSKPTAPVLTPISPSLQQSAGNSLLSLLKSAPALAAQSANVAQKSVVSQPPSLSSNPLLKNLLVRENIVAPLPIPPAGTRNEIIATPTQAYHEQQENITQAQPVELAATSAIDSTQEPKMPSADETKANLMSLLGSMPPKTPKAVERTISSRPNSGNFSSIPPPPLSLSPKPETPITSLHKQKESITLPAKPKTPTATEHRPRDASNSARKLYDHKNDEFKDSPIVKQIAKPRDRPHSAQPQKTYVPRPPNSPRRPATPKEQPKPFTPTILKRPQSGEETKDVPVFELAKPEIEEAKHNEKDDFAEDEQSPTKEIEKPPREPVRMPSTNLLGLFSSPRVVSRGPPPPDPQREALLDLLRPAKVSSESRQVKSVEGEVSSELQLGNMSSVFNAPPAAETLPSPIVPASRVVSPPQQQSLLDLLRSPPVLSKIGVVSPVSAPAQALSEPSRVSSLTPVAKGAASTTNLATTIPPTNISPVSSKPQVEKRQTNAGDKAFLMSYLKNFTKQEA
ncbi:mRNA-decapping enzyme subunit 2, partial [Elasticomyces elasticus]